jgi:transcription elongation factor SPT5
MCSYNNTSLLCNAVGGRFGGRGGGGGRGHDSLVNRCIKIKSGPYKGYRGRVKEVNGALVRIELDSLMKIVTGKLTLYCKCSCSCFSYFSSEIYTNIQLRERILVTQLLLQHHFGKFPLVCHPYLHIVSFANKLISSETRYSRGVETPVHPSQTPLHHIQTPIQDSGGVFLHDLLWFI